MRNIRIKEVCTHFILSILLVFSSCQQGLNLENGGSDESVQVGFYAGGRQTRTEMLPNGLSAAWVAGDEMALWAKDASGSYVLSNQKFITYGIDGSFGFFTSTLPSAMEDGTYTYYCSYPVPSEVNGTKVSFDIPSVQDGKVSGGADVMISYPKTHGALTPVPDPEDHSGMSVVMKRLMHQFRFFIPGDNTVIGDQTLQRIILTFPSGVVGKAVWDIEDPDAAPVLSESSTTAELSLSEPLGISAQDIDYACFAFVPQKFTEGQVMKIKAYTKDKIAYFDDVDLCARDFQAGHSTPVRLNVKEIADYPYRITFYVSQNNLGENVNKIILTAPEGCRWDDTGSNVYTYEPGYQVSTGEAIAIRFEDENQYRAFSGKDISVTYDSDNAVTYQTVRVPDLSSVDVTMVTLQVPYLLYQDFSSIGTYSDGHDNPGVGGVVSDTYKGITELSSIGMAGWYGARIGIQGGTSARICCRYEHVLLDGAYYKGRLYSPQFTALKEDKDVKISVSFSYGANRSETKCVNNGPWYNPNWVTPNKSPILYFGINSQDVVTNPDNVEGDIIDSITGMVAGSGFSNPVPSSLTPKPNPIAGEHLAVGASYTNIPSTKNNITIDKVDKNMRLGWIITTDMAVSNTHANYWFYIDNIKVQITK